MIEIQDAENMRRELIDMKKEEDLMKYYLDNEEKDKEIRMNKKLVDEVHKMIMERQRLEEEAEKKILLEFEKRKQERERYYMGLEDKQTNMFRQREMRSKKEKMIWNEILKETPKKFDDLDDRRLLAPDYVASNYNKILNTHHTLNIEKVNLNMKDILPTNNNFYKSLGLKYNTIKHLQENDPNAKSKRKFSPIQSQNVNNMQQLKDIKPIKTNKMKRIGSVTDLKKERYEDKKKKPFFHGDFGVISKPILK